ncbi:Tether containing UBX domain for GLUT4 [Purpureocillium lavendulum]|uniref:Tether containing UBX domain for GLUT4 n=1 Tax=Purpureocillium lavendulum TaxID=1247861 RepID=A0AB34G499_9HYPO|nr:Tether containing UBX domain for GLUT4 [Purpureocillium lavendulum]
MAAPDAGFTHSVRTPAAVPSCLSSTAQARILIWRTEVASALAAPPKSSPSSSASTASSLPSAPSSATFTTTASPPGDDGTAGQPGKSGRRHRFWRRLVRRLSLRATGPDGSTHAALLDGTGIPPEACPGGVLPGGEVIRTAMYHQDAAPPPPNDNPVGPQQDDDALHDADSSEDDVLRKQKKQQERLQRAARLLSQQNVRASA